MIKMKFCSRCILSLVMLVFAFQIVGCLNHNRYSKSNLANNETSQLNDDLIIDFIKNSNYFKNSTLVSINKSTSDNRYWVCDNELFLCMILYIKNKSVIIEKQLPIEFTINNEKIIECSVIVKLHRKSEIWDDNKRASILDQLIIQSKNDTNSELSELIKNKIHSVNEISQCKELLINMYLEYHDISSYQNKHHDINSPIPDNMEIPRINRDTYH